LPLISKFITLYDKLLNIARTLFKIF